MNDWDEPETDDGDVQELMDGLAKTEKSRQRRALFIGLSIAGLLAAIGTLAVLYSDTFFRPELDIAGGEEDVLAETNDPECRGFIEKVTAIEADYRGIEPMVERMMTSDDSEELREIEKTTDRLRARLDKQEVASLDAKLRFEESRGELDDWFSHIDNELELVGDLAAFRLRQIGAVEPGEGEGTAVDADAGSAEGGASDSDASDSGAGGTNEGEVVHVEAKPEGNPTGAARVASSSKTPKELHEGSMLAVHEAFQSFRVWHTGSLHPCGQADEDETGWTPDGRAAPAKGEAASQGKSK